MTNTVEYHATLYWSLSKAYRHPKSKALSAESMIKSLSALKAEKLSKALQDQVEELLNEVVGTSTGLKGKSFDIIIIDECCADCGGWPDFEPPGAA